MIQNYLPDITNIPSGLKEASSVELQETGVTLYVDNCVHMIKRQQSQRKAFKAEINELKEVKPDWVRWERYRQVCHEMSQVHECAHPQ